MSKRDLRKLLHLLAFVCWLIGLAQDVKERRWGAFVCAIVLHALAEGLGGEQGDLGART